MSNHVGSVILSRGHLAYSVCCHQCDSPIVIVLHLNKFLIILKLFLHFLHFFLKVLTGQLLLGKLIVNVLVFLGEDTSLSGVEGADSLDSCGCNGVGILIEVLASLQIVEEGTFSLPSKCDLVLFLGNCFSLNINIKHVLINVFDWLCWCLCYLFLFLGFSKSADKTSDNGAML